MCSGARAACWQLDPITVSCLGSSVDVLWWLISLMGVREASPQFLSPGAGWICCACTAHPDTRPFIFDGVWMNYAHSH